MERISGTLLVVVTWVASIVLMATAHGFQRETDVIPVLIDGEFVPEPFSGGAQWPRAALADIDGDSDFDLLVGDHDGGVHFYRNGGAAEQYSFVPEPQVLAEMKVGSRAAPTVVDIDDDGDLDLFLGELDGDYTSTAKATSLASFFVPALCGVENDLKGGALCGESRQPS